MGSHLGEPNAVVLVCDDESEVRPVKSALLDGPAATVEVVGSAEATADAVGARSDIGCILAIDVGPSDVGAIRDAIADEHLPLVVYGQPDTATMSAVARRASCRFLPRSADADALERTIENAVETYERRSNAALDSTAFQTLLAEGELSMFVKDKQGRHLRMADVADTPNPEDVLGATDIDVYGQFDEETARKTYADDLRVVKIGEPIREQIERQDGPAGAHWTETTKLPWEHGQSRGVVGYTIDVTDRERCRRRLQDLRDRIDQFAGYVSHDLRTPLQVIDGAVEQARAGDTEALDRIERATDRIEEILDDLRALSKGHQSMTELSPEAKRALDIVTPETDLRTLIEDLWEAQAVGQATLELTVPRGTIVVAEAETLRPTIENLLTNAIDHAGPDVTVRIGTTDRGFFVADDGPGIPDDDRETVLEAGYTTSDTGSGTGLSIVSETADRQGWQVRVTESAEGGARLEITDCPVVLPHDVMPGEELELDEHQDVGDVEIPGETIHDDEADVWTVRGDGQDIWQDIDEFHFASTQVDGPARIEAEIAAFDGTHPYSKAGLMVRAGVSADAPFAFVGVTGDHGTETLRRDAMGVDARSDQLEEPWDVYRFYRLDAVDGRVTCSVSTDREEWYALDQFPIEYGDTPAVGLAVCSHSGTETSEARFADVTVRELDVT